MKKPDPYRCCKGCPRRSGVCHIDCAEYLAARPHKKSPDPEAEVDRYFAARYDRIQRWLHRTRKK